MFGIFRCAVAATTALLMASTASAAVVVTASESGGDVVFSTAPGGTLDLTGLALFSTTGNTVAQIQPLVAGGPRIIMGPASSTPFDLYTGVTSFPAPFGNTVGQPADSGSGDIFGVGPQFGGALVVPSDFISGGSVSATSTYAGETIASLGLIPGTYVWSWGSDSFTLTVVPVPAAAWLFVSSLGVLGWLRRRRT